MYPWLIQPSGSRTRCEQGAWCSLRGCRGGSGDGREWQTGSGTHLEFGRTGCRITANLLLRTNWGNPVLHVPDTQRPWESSCIKHRNEANILKQKGYSCLLCSLNHPILPTPSESVVSCPFAFSESEEQHTALLSWLDRELFRICQERHPHVHECFSSSLSFLYLNRLIV